MVGPILCTIDARGSESSIFLQGNPNSLTLKKNVNEKGKSSTFEARGSGFSLLHNGIPKSLALSKKVKDKEKVP